MEEKAINPYPVKGILAAIGCAIALACGPAAATAINVVTPQVVAALNTTLVTTAYRSMFSTIVAFILGLVGVKLYKVIPPRYFIYAGPVIGSGALAWAAVTTSIPAFTATGFLTGIAMILCAYPAVASVCNDWFGKNSNKVFGIISGVQVFLIALMFYIIGQLLATMDYRQALLLVAGVCGIGGCIIALLLVRKPDETAVGLYEKKVALERQAAGEEATEFEKEQVDGLTVKEAMKTGALWLLLVCVFFGGINITGMNSYLTTIFMYNGASATTAATWLSYWTFAGGVTMLVSGIIQRKTNSTVMCWLMFGGYIIGCILLALWLQTPSIAILAVLACVVMSCIKPDTLISGMCTPELFGKKEYSSLTSFVQGFYFAGIAVCMILIAWIIENFGAMTAVTCQIIFAAIAATAVTFSMRMSPYKKMKAAKAKQENKDANAV